MAEATCRRELDLEIPADEVAKAMQRVAKEFARVARVPGFRPAKPPDSLIRPRSPDAIKGDVVQSLCPTRAEEAMEPFKEKLGGASIGDHKNFDVQYPSDYPDAKLAGKTYHYAVEVLGLKTKKLPELNDEFAKDVSDAGSLDELKTKLRQSLEAARDQKHKDLLREKVLAAIVKLHDFPVPESLVEHQMDVRLERVVRSLPPQGVDPRAENVDWVTLRLPQQNRATNAVKPHLIIYRSA